METLEHIKCRIRDVLIVSKIFGVPLVFFGLMGFFYFKMTIAFYIYLIVGLILLGMKLMIASTDDSFCQKLSWFGITLYKKSFLFKNYKCIELDIESSDSSAGSHSVSKRTVKLFAIYLVPKVTYNPKPYLLKHCIKGEANVNAKNLPKIKEKVNILSEISGLAVCYSEQYNTEMKTIKERDAVKI